MVQFSSRGHMALAFAWCFVVNATSAAADYTGIDLYPLSLPPGYTDPQGLRGQSAFGGQAAGSAYILEPGEIQHALLWDHGPNPVDLNPAQLGFGISVAIATDGVHQVGFGGIGTDTTASGHALFWSGTSASAVDISPTNLPGIQGSIAWAISGNQIFGEGVVANGDTHPLLWNSVGTVAVDLQPTLLAGIAAIHPNGTDGHHQVGTGLYNGSTLHAMQWSGTAESAVDLSPTNLPGYTLSGAQGVHGTQVVGGGNGPATDGHDHALLWTGGADSAVDLNPENFTTSIAYASNGMIQVGEGTGPGTGGGLHALLWSGTAASAQDLNGLLPQGFNNSYAYSIDSSGNIFGFANDATGNLHAVEWAVPEPSSCTLAMTLLPLVWRRRL